jgi:hypothetical protein
LTSAKAHPSPFSWPDSPTYQWRHDGIDLTDGGAISGSDTPTLSIDPVLETDAGSYDVVVANACGEALSNGAELLVLAACIADVVPPQGDGEVNIDDIFGIIGAWSSADPQYDIAPVPPAGPNGVVDIDDLFVVLGGWGPCS